MIRAHTELDVEIKREIMESPLGKTSATSETYDPALLYRLHRAPNRERIGIDADKPLPFIGADLWTAFELSWLTPRGKPQVAIASFTVPCNTPCMVESKSFKLYLNSLHNTRFADAQAVRACIRKDLSHALWDGAENPPQIGVTLIEPQDFAGQRIDELEGTRLDRLDLDCDPSATPDASLLRADHNEAPVSETLVSHLLKSNCPVTNQPDWGSVQITYSGPALDHAALLRYIVSFRNHQDFHEHCCERMFADIWAVCKPSKLAVYTRYTRRGGLDINPIRSSFPMPLPPNLRSARQ
jgi:7-cyano-7-deazaguanine reductase